MILHINQGAFRVGFAVFRMCQGEYLLLELVFDGTQEAIHGAGIDESPVSSVNGASACFDDGGAIRLGGLKYISSPI